MGPGSTLRRAITSTGLAVLLAAGACAPSEGSTDQPAPDAAAAEPPNACKPAGVARNPTSIAEAVALVNALPRPLTLTCFLQSLQRPLRVNATNGTISLQPARGSRSPRLFLFSGKLVSSIVPEGSGASLVEFGEFVDDTRTVKGEIAFPMDGPLDPGEPFRRIMDKGRTSCGGCHRGEEPAEHLPFPEATISAAVRPVPSSRVDMERVWQEHRTCDKAAEPERCAILSALLDHGEVIPWEFPTTLPTIFY